MTASCFLVASGLELLLSMGTNQDFTKLCRVAAILRTAVSGFFGEQCGLLSP